MPQDFSANFKEYTLSVNEFLQPKVLSGESAAFISIMRLFLLEPGTIQTHPDMGIGIRSRYRFSDTADIGKLKQDIKDQIRTYLPNLVVIDVQVETYGTSLAIFISSDDDIIYALGYDTNTGSLKILTLEDLK